MVKQKVKSLKRQSTDSHRLKGIRKNKPHKNGKFTESLGYVYFCFILNCFDCE